MNDSAPLELEAARERILALVPPAQTELVELSQAHQRILTGRLTAPLELPPFDNSAMDGYAVRAADLRGASAGSPVELSLHGRVAAGEVFSGEVASGSCVRLFTGSPLPRGADAVVMQEDTRINPGQTDCVSFLDSVKPWENVRFRGEDVQHGSVLAESGAPLTAGRLNLLAAAGMTQVAVGRRPVVGLLATGSELIEAGQPLSPGQIYESNRRGLAALATLAGAVPRVFPLVPDTQAGTQAALESAFRECDMVVTSGGVSVGEMDFIKSAFTALGGEVDFWKVAIRPGRPFVFGRHQSKFLFGLPGNPVSAFVTFLLLVRPALRRWQGAGEVNLPVYPGTLAEPLSNHGGRRHFVRVTVDTDGKVRSSGVQASHTMASLAAANGLVDLAPGLIFPSGTTVPVMVWE
jgi:molybdopterin molybdotransferase